MYARKINKIIQYNYNIDPISIKRTNSYHSRKLKYRIASATAIREALKNHIDISHLVPYSSLKYINNNMDIENFFPLLKYKIISEIDNLNRYQTVYEGI